MSNRNNSPPGAMGRLMNKIKKTVSTDQDLSRDPGYQRVETGDLLTSTTPSLDTVVIDSGTDITSLHTTIDKSREFSPFETNDIPAKRQDRKFKSSIKGSKVSFEEDQFDTDDDNFMNRRDQFQQRKGISTTDNKGIFKDLKHLVEDDNRKDFQSKKHVSLDVKHSKILEDILKNSPSDDEFKDNRQDFQSRKHQSLDARVSFKLPDNEGITTSSSDEDFDIESKHLIHDKYRDITKPVIIDLKDFESSEDEDFLSTRQSFQQQRSVSTESRKSLHRFLEMDDMNNTKRDNIRSSVPYVRQITQDGKPKLEVYRPTTNPIYYYTQVLAALSVSMGSMVVGFTSAYTSPALVSMTDRNITSFEVTPQSASWVGGIMPLAGLAGGIAGGPLIEYIGRKTTILATAIPFIVSFLLIAFANSIALVLVGRGLSGFCVGIASLSFPVYLGETLQPEVRGSLGLLPTAFGNVGILVAFVAGKYLTWSHLAFFGAALPVVFLILMCFIPETPRWYVGRNNEGRARSALKWLRGREADIEPEIKGILKTNADAERHASKNAIFDLLKKSNLKPLMISLGLMFFQQLSGINAVIFYTVTIFKSAGSSIDENLCTIIVGIVNFMATFGATLVIDRLGRKILLYISNISMIITLFILGTFFYLKSIGRDVSGVGWLPLASFVLFVIGFSFGFGPIPWLMMGEILPAKIRGSAASVATGFNWACTFLVTKTFVDIVASVGEHGAFWMFGSICIVGLFFIIFCVPETQGKSLEDIERKMMGRVRRMSSVANMRPLSFNM